MKNHIFTVALIIQRKVKRVPKLKGTPYPLELHTIGDHIRKVRVDRKLLQTEVASLLGVCEESLSGWENNRSQPQIKYYKRIIQFLGYYPFNHDTNTLGGRILKYRYTKSLTQRQMGRKVGVNATTINAWETRENSPQVASLEKLNKILKTN
ncbi:MAG TPA: helix-turn-helix domain-containing protein [Chitinophagaceae bacterium]|nr:helix-turn-helix domain-containing protein [Chitinophagaceae bacterium]